MFLPSPLLICLIFCVKLDNCKILKRTTRIIHGQPTDITTFPHHVRIDAPNRKYICGGSIISNKAILTAAHCITDGQNLTIRIGADSSRGNGGAIADIDQIIRHPQFDFWSLTHDLAVILLKDDLFRNNNNLIGKIEIARVNGVFPGEAKIVGWGCTACIWFVPIWICQLFPPSRWLRYGTVVLDRKEGSMIVSNSKVKGCPGDSGGPVIDSGGKLVGVISHLDVYFLRNRPNYFTSVPDHLEWINEVVGG